MNMKEAKQRIYCNEYWRAHVGSQGNHGSAHANACDAVDAFKAKFSNKDKGGALAFAVDGFLRLTDGANFEAAASKARYATDNGYREAFSE